MVLSSKLFDLVCLDVKKFSNNSDLMDDLKDGLRTPPQHNYRDNYILSTFMSYMSLEELLERNK